MKVSIAMTTYCGQKYVLEQLRSLVEQSRCPDEVVICDDRSSDATVQIVQQFIQEHQLKNWRVLTNSSNLGYVRNFKKAMSETTGDIVFLCDQDDVWHADKIQRMTQEMENNPQILALVCGYQLINGDGELMHTDIKHLDGNATGKGASAAMVKHGKVLYSNIAQGCTSAYRRELVDTYCNMDNCNKMPHDWALNMLAYEQKGLFRLNEELISYRLHGNNAIGLPTPQQAILERVPRIRNYADCITDARQLPLQQWTLRELEKLERFSNTRVAWLQQRRIHIWLGGFFSCFSVIMRYYFLQYMKDLALVLLGKIPAKEAGPESGR